MYELGVHGVEYLQFCIHHSPNVFQVNCWSLVSNFTEFIILGMPQEVWVKSYEMKLEHSKAPTGALLKIFQRH